MLPRITRLSKFKVEWLKSLPVVVLLTYCTRICGVSNVGTLGLDVFTSRINVQSRRCELFTGLGISQYAQIKLRWQKN